MPGFTFELMQQKPDRRRERRTTFRLLVGTAGPYGEVALKVTNYPREATLVGEGLPEASISHPDASYGSIPIDARTRLMVGGVAAQLTQNRRALRKEDRGIGIKLGHRDYTYVCADTGREELRDSTRGPVVREDGFGADSAVRIVVLSGADATDLAVGILMQGANTLGLTVGGAVFSGVMSFLNGSKGQG